MPFFYMFPFFFFWEQSLKPLLIKYGKDRFRSDYFGKDSVPFLRIIVINEILCKRSGDLLICESLLFACICYDVRFDL